MSQTIKFTDVETNEEIEFEVVEETRVNNVNYLLVTEAKYEIVEDDNELEYISKIFEELLEDVDIN